MSDVEVGRRFDIVDNFKFMYNTYFCNLEISMDILLNIG